MSETVGNAEAHPTANGYSEAVRVVAAVLSEW
jgi:hypothetical protein